MDLGSRLIIQHAWGAGIAVFCDSARASQTWRNHAMCVPPRSPWELRVLWRQTNGCRRAHALSTIFVRARFGTLPLFPLSARRLARKDASSAAASSFPRVAAALVSYSPCRLGHEPTWSNLVPLARCFVSKENSSVGHPPVSVLRVQAGLTRHTGPLFQGRFREQGVLPVGDSEILTEETRGSHWDKLCQTLSATSLSTASKYFPRSVVSQGCFRSSPSHQWM